MLVNEMLYKTDTYDILLKNSYERLFKRLIVRFRYNIQAC